MMQKLADISMFEGLQSRGSTGSIAVFNGSLTGDVVVIADVEEIEGLRISDADDEQYGYAKGIVVDLLTEALDSANPKMSEDQKKRVQWYKKEVRDAVKALCDRGVIDEARGFETSPKFKQFVSDVVERLIDRDPIAAGPNYYRRLGGFSGQGYLRS